MACKDGFCQEEGDGDSDVPRVYPDPLLLFLFGDCLVSVSTVSLSAVLKPPARSSAAAQLMDQSLFWFCSF